MTCVKQESSGRSARPASRIGYTLLEVVLALGLSVLVIGGITVAINYHLSTLRLQQAEIERSQVARQSLFLITRDIRAAIQYKPIESSALDELIESVSSATDLTGLAEQAGLDQETLDQAGVAPPDTSEPAEESDYAPTRPGLYGTSSQLQIDISRLPRRDQYNLVTFSDGTQSDIPSDVKTVTYFVRSEENQTTGSSNAVDLSNARGLIRRSLDRAVTRYSLDYGAELNLEDYEDVLAEEISEIEFRYWDQVNGEWLSEWDSDEMMGLPGAVEVTIAVGQQSADPDNPAEERKIYRSVVYLPLAEIIEPEPETTDAESASGDGSDSGSESDGADSGSEGGSR